MLQYLNLFGRSINLFNLFNSLGSYSIAVWVILNLKEYKEVSTFSQIAQTKIGKNRDNFFFRWFFVVIEFLLFYAVILIAEAPVAGVVSKITLGDTSPNFFYNIFALPFMLIIISIIFRAAPLKVLDLMAPAVCLALIFFKIACFCLGCCYGVEAEKFGIYNVCNERAEFPVQLVEAACAIIMFVILLLIRRKKNRKTGVLYPVFILMYCGSRFVSEFWRDDFPNVLGPLKGYHIQCIVGFVEGLILLFIVLKWSDKISAYYSSKRQKLIAKFCGEPSEDNNSEE